MDCGIKGLRLGPESTEEKSRGVERGRGTAKWCQVEKGKSRATGRMGGPLLPPGGPGIEAYKRASVPSQCLQGFCIFAKRTGLAVRTLGAEAEVLKWGILHL